MSIFKKGSIRHTIIVVSVAVVIIAASVVVSPKQGACDTTDQSGNAIAVALSDTESDPYRSSVEPVAPSEYHPPIFIQQEETAGQEYHHPVNYTFSSSVNKALKYMRVTSEHLNMWAEKRPDSALNKLASLDDEQQKRVAYIACYIRKCNRHISAETIWREACAIYFGGKQYGLSPELIAAVARVESHFNPTSVSRHGACGVMQVMYKVHYARLAKLHIASKRADMFDPERGVYAGIVVLKGYVAGTGSIHKGLMRYLGGHSRRYYMNVQNHITKIRLNGEKLGL